MSFLEIKSAVDRLAEAHEAYKETNDKRLAALEKGDKSTAAELATKLEKIDADVSKFAALKSQIEKEHEFQRERIEMLEARASNPKKTVVDQIHDEHMNAFTDWIRAKGAPEASARLGALQQKAAANAETKTLAIAVPSHGGYAVPEQIAREIERMELLYSPVRNLVKVVQANTSDYKELVNLRGAEAGWVGETGTRAETATPLLREVVPTQGELYCYPKASEWLLDDSFFDIQSWLAEEAAQTFAVLEGAAVISGSGTNRPTGMLNTPPVLTADTASPVRAAAAYQYIASDTDADGSPATPGIRADSLLDLVYALNSMYRMRATWTMNSATTASVRKLKNSDGDYLWAPGLVAGQPDRLLGYPVATWEQMPDVADGEFPIAFGDFRRGYVLVDRVGMRITVDNGITTPGFVKFYMRRREGGHVLNNDAIKFLGVIQ